MLFVFLNKICIELDRRDYSILEKEVKEVKQNISLDASLPSLKVNYSVLCLRLHLLEVATLQQPDYPPTLIQMVTFLETIPSQG